MENYDFELDKIAKTLLEEKPGSVLVQLPDGLKPEATAIADSLKKYCKNVYIWLGSCYGACDVPKLDVDMIIQFGHNQLKI